MSKKPLDINARTITTRPQTPRAGAGMPQRGQTVSETLVDLNFKVPAEFRRRFKQLALDGDLKNVQLLRRAVEAYERMHGR